MTRTILLADDSVTIQKVVELTFMDEDFQVETVGTGTEALDQLEAIRPDLVLADVHMPGADGYEVCQRTREILPATPVLLLVGTFEVFDQDRAARVGASGHLKKPFDSQELLRRVKELLAAPPPAWEAIEAPSGEILVPIEEPGWLPEPAAPAAPPATDWNLEAPPETSWSLEPPAPIEPVAPPPAPAPVAAAPSAPSPSVAELPAAASGNGGGGPLSEADVERIARRVVELLGEGVVREVAWEVVPDLAEVLLKARIRELEASVE